MAANQPTGARSVVLGVTAAALLIALQVAAKATRDAFFLSQFAATQLPPVMLTATVVSVLVVFALTSAMARWSPGGVTAVALVLNALIYAAESLLSAHAAGVAAVVVYLHVAGTGAALVSGFWSVVNELYDPHTAKRTVPQIAAGATFGGLIGGLGVWAVRDVADFGGVLGALAVVSLGGAGLVGPLGLRGQRLSKSARKSRPTTPDEGVKTILRTPYVRSIAVFVIVWAVAETLIDYVLKARASTAFSATGDLVAFFALFYTGLSFATFVLQSTLSRRLLHKYGLATTIALLPALSILGGAAALFFQRLWSAMILKGATAATENSLFRSGYELLYTPLRPDQKRSVKAILDVGCERLGGAIGAGLVFLLLLLPSHAEASVVGLTLVLSATCLWTSRRLHQGYVTALGESLVSGSIRLTEEDVTDATTRRTLADTTAMISRKSLLAEIAQLRTSQGHESEVPEGAGFAAEDVDENWQALQSRDPDRVHAVLTGKGGLGPEHVALLIGLLRDDRFTPGVMRRFAQMERCVTGQLLDTLLDETADPKIRRRIPKALTAQPNQRAIDGLALALSDPSFEIQYRSSLALRFIIDQVPEALVPETAILRAAQSAPRGETKLSMPPGRGDASLSFWDSPQNQERGKSLEYVFILLSMILEREPLQLAYRALATRDQNLRGTALEYLENVLPETIKEAIWRHIEDAEQARALIRPHSQVLDELLLSVDSAGIDVGTLRRSSAS